MRPVLLLEINEIPWRILDLYLKDPSYPRLRRFFESSQTYTNVAVDSGELSPWVTWPTFHRGIANDLHGIKNLGQDRRSFRGEPIWQTYLNEGRSIGICGTLQSWPPLYPGERGFYIPDTFAHDESCVPAWVEPFQRFNLSQTGQNGRVVRRGSLLSLDSLRLMARIPRLGLRLRTIARTLAQLVSERFETRRTARRPVFQCIFFWDIFRKLFDAKAPPDFSTFFTNHIAGVQHRYWHHVFPEDFDERYRDSDRYHKKTMDFAFAVFDGMLGDVMHWAERNPELIVVLASSMGQAAVHRDGHEGIELILQGPEKLLAALGFTPNDYSPLLAMSPQIAIEAKDPRKLDAIRERLDACRTGSGAKLFSTSEVQSTLSISFVTPKAADMRASGFYCDAKPISWNDAGFEIIESEPGTAYHIDEGAMAVYGRGVKPSAARTRLRADRAKDFILSLRHGAMPLSANRHENDGSRPPSFELG
jgi:hypothetical protein